MVTGSSGVSMMNNCRFVLCLVLLSLAGQSVFALDADPLESVKDHVYDLLSSAEVPESTGYYRENYIETIDGILNFFRDYQQMDGSIFDPYTNNEVQYATPYYAMCGSVVYVNNYRSENANAVIVDAGFLESISLALDRATYELYTRSCANGHSNFFTMPCMVAYLNLRDYVSTTRRQLWESRLSGMSTSQYATNTLNWNLTASVGDYLRYINGLTTNITYMEDHIEENIPQLTLQGIYRDGNYPYAPMAYDGFARLNFQVLLLNGYGDTSFPGADDLGEYIRRGAFTGMMMQSPWGETPMGGRSAQHQWNETEMCFIYEVWADQMYEEGNTVLAGAFKRAAHLAYSSLLRWVRPNGSVWIVKNYLDPALRFGYESYSYLSQYNMWTAGGLALAAMYANDSISEGASPADIGGYAFDVPEIHRGFANCGGLYLQFDMDPKDTYNTAGLVRIHKKGVEPLVGPSASTSEVQVLDGVPELGHGVGWYNGSGWSSLAEMSSDQITSFDFTVNSMSSELLDLTINYNFTEVDGANSVTEHYSIDPDEVYVTAKVNGPKTFTKVRYAGFLYDGAREFTVGYDDGIAQTKYGDNLMTMELVSHPETPFDRSFDTVNSRNGYLEAIEAVVNDSEVSYILRPEIDEDGTKFTAANSFTGLGSEVLPGHEVEDSLAGSEQSGNAKENAYDDNEATRWCNDGMLNNGWITFDLGSVQQVGQVNILYYNGHRNYPIMIETSVDGSTWGQVYNGGSGEMGSDYWACSFTEVSARYVRITLTDYNSDGSYWFSIYEVNFWQAAQTDTTAPAVPMGLETISGDYTVFLNWNDNSESDFSYYNVKRSTTSGGSYATIESNIGVSNYMDNSVTNGVTYYYVLTAVDTSGNESVVSGEVSGMAVDVTSPESPSGLEASANNGVVTLDWNDNSDPDLARYNVYRSMFSGGPYSMLASAVVDSGYEDDTVTNGLTYYYVVTAVDEAGLESGYSNEADAISIVRQEFAIVSSTYGSEESGNVDENSYDDNESTRWCNDGYLSDPLDWAWIQYDLGGAEYIDHIELMLYKGTSRTYPILIEVSMDASTWTTVFDGNTDVSDDYWQVTFDTVSSRYVRLTLADYNSDGGSWFSIYEAQIWGPENYDITAPSALTNVTAVAENGAIVINWDASSDSDVAGYYVKRSIVIGGDYSTIGGVIAGTTTFTDLTAEAGIRYYYIVTALDASSNESSGSNRQYAPQYAGDLTLDNTVDMFDMAMLGSGWMGDFDLTNLVDVASDWLE